MKPLNEKNIDLAIDWIVAKTEELGEKLDNSREKSFRKDLYDFIQSDYKRFGDFSFVGTSSIFLSRKCGNMSMQDILKSNNINVFNDHIISVTINQKEVVVVDGYGGKRHGVRKLSSGEFEYSAPKAFLRSSVF
jgi:hypothetical protein